MPYKKKIILLLALSVILFAVGYVLLHPEIFGLCLPTSSGCNYPNEFTYGQPIVVGMPFLIIIFLLLLFLSEPIFKAWSKFLLVFVPLSVLFIVFLPTFCGNSIICLTKLLSIKLLGAVFLVISLAIIIYKKVRESKVI